MSSGGKRLEADTARRIKIGINFAIIVSRDGRAVPASKRSDTTGVDTQARPPAINDATLLESNVLCHKVAAPDERSIH